MQVSTSAFYMWLKAPTDINKQMEKLEAKACQLFNEYKQTYGYRWLSDALNKAGMKSGHYQVCHLMARLRLKVCYPKRFKVTTNSNHNELISPNTLDQKFDVVSPNQVWTTDITYVWTPQGWLYMVIVMDLLSRQIVGWAICRSHEGILVCERVTNGFLAKKTGAWILHHSEESISLIVSSMRSLAVVTIYRVFYKFLGLNQSFLRIHATPGRADSPAKTEPYPLSWHARTQCQVACRNYSRREKRQK